MENRSGGCKKMKLLKVMPKKTLFLRTEVGKGSLGKDKFEFGYILPSGANYVYYKEKYCIVSTEALVRIATKLIDKE